MNIKKNFIVDAEVRLVHPEARDVNFAKHSNELTRIDVYSSPSIHDATKLWGVESMLKSMNKNKIDVGILAGLAWKDPKILDDNNKYIHECLINHPERFKGLYTVHPQNPKQAAQEILKLPDNLYVGVELIPKWQATHIDCPSLRPIFEAVVEKSFVMKAYTAHPTQTLDGDAPYRTLQILKRHPEMKVLIPHLGGMLCLYGLFPPINKYLRNAWFITSVSATMKMVEFAASVNPRNLLFGTDYPFNHCFSQEEPLNEFKKLGLSDSVAKNILGFNAKKIFNI